MKHFPPSLPVDFLSSHLLAPTSTQADLSFPLNINNRTCEATKLDEEQ
jgi:hypothetical protein